jgi:hypothetical protein
MAKNQLDNNDQFKRVSIKSLHVGDILVHGASARHPHGHIAVYLGNGKEASDHIGRLITGARYGGTTVFRAVAPTAVASADVTPSVPQAAEVDSANQAPVEAPITDVESVPTAQAVDATQTAEEPVATANVPAVSPAPVHPLDLSTPLSSALIKVVEIAQSAQINIGQALADAIGAFSS